MTQKEEISQPNILQVLNALRVRILAGGGEVIDLSAGTPDLPPAPHVMRAVSEAAADPENYKYVLRDLPDLTDAAVSWYARRYGVRLDAEQVIAVYGTQEGLPHLFHVLCKPGDLVLVGTPNYPLFSFAPTLAGAEAVLVPLRPENGFLIDFSEIDPAVARKARVILASYPSNPLGAVAPPSFYEDLVRFAKEYDLVVVHDNAYSELVHDGPPGGSFLATPGAMDVGVEFNSLSKTYNLSGLRISFALGNREVLAAYRRFRTQIDYGLSAIDQIAAVAALTGPQDIVESNRAAYRSRRDAFVDALRGLGWDVPKTPATMFTWFPIPARYGKDDKRFCMELAEKTGVLSVPGSSAGPGGEGWVRFALVQPGDVLLRAAEKIATLL
ncbi:MAG: aminotransferase class I/II-fold pyridoxal phosphate-dependent enzyme [Clostridiales Family XIII bacterium]|jgi:LL-diaminopimelate aminotransferase|nr:aminotransferase class I/II-fold pyridoxal phosphate-dependent enzyme [Clostridiales Family XIII bacterium]